MQKVNLNSVDDGATRRSNTSVLALAGKNHTLSALASCFKLRSRVCQTYGLGLLTAVGLGLAPNGALAAGPADEFHVVAYVGDAAPGGGVFTNDFEPTALNNRGQLAFTAEPDKPGEEGIFLAHHGTLSQVVRFGESAPGGGMFTDVEFGDIGLNDAGQVAFGFTLTNSAGVYRWSDVDQTLSPILIPNVTLAPGDAGLFGGSSGSPSINNRGTVAFLGDVTNPPPTTFKFKPYRTGVFVADKAGNISTVVRPGDPAPGGGTFMSAGKMFAGIFGFLFVGVGVNAHINDAGDVAFPGQVSTAPNKFTAFVRRFATGAIEALPMPPGVATGFVATITINNRGDVAFGGAQNLEGYVFSSLVGAVYLSSGGTTISVAALHDAAPGGGLFTTFRPQLRLNNRGDLAFAAETDTHDQAMYVYSSATGTLRRIGGIGTAIPGAGVIVDLNQFGRLAGYTAFNDHGQIALVANVTDGTTIRRALLLATPSNGAN